MSYPKCFAVFVSTPKHQLCALDIRLCNAIKAVVNASTVSAEKLLFYNFHNDFAPIRCYM